MSSATDLQARAQKFLDADAEMERGYLTKDERSKRRRARTAAGDSLGSHSPSLARQIIRAIVMARVEGVIA